MKPNSNCAASDIILLFQGGFQVTVNQLLEKVTLHELVSGEKESENILKEMLMNSSRTAVEKLALNQL